LRLFILEEGYCCGNEIGDKRGLLYCTAGDAQGLMFESNGQMVKEGGLPLIVGTRDCEADGKGIVLYKGDGK
jgi:hypothetical protein